MRAQLLRVLETERLYLEPVRAAHAEEAWEELSDPRLWTYFPSLRPRTIGDLHARYARWEDGAADAPAGEIWANWVCRLKSSGRLAGAVQATVAPPDHAYVAYMIYVPQQRRGYAKEAVRGLVTYLHEVCGLHRFRAEIAPANAASCALITSLGFAPVEESRIHEGADQLFCLELLSAQR